MPEGELPERPRDALTSKDTHKPPEQTPARWIDQNLFGRLRDTPAGEDPAFWPIHVLNELNSYIDHREQLSNLPGDWDATPRETAETFAPIQENIRRVKTAYEILAYPHCKLEDRREEIEAELGKDHELTGRDQVELDDTELKILGKLSAVRNIPFSPDKRVYTYEEVLHPSQPIEKARREISRANPLGCQQWHG
jgi:hypothetical protein